MNEKKNKAGKINEYYLQSSVNDRGKCCIFDVVEEDENWESSEFGEENFVMEKHSYFYETITRYTVNGKSNH